MKSTVCARARVCVCVCVCVIMSTVYVGYKLAQIAKRNKETK